MKKLIYTVITCFIILLFNSCSLDDGNTTTFEVLPIQSIELPQSFNFGETYTINYTYLRPTNCHAHDGILLRANDSTRTMAVSTFLVNGGGCGTLTYPDNEASQSFDFNVLYDYTYIFKIWKGKDAQGEDIYETYEVPVNN